MASVPEMTSEAETASESETTAFIREKWEILTRSTDVEKGAQDKWWDFLTSCYSEPSRKYYTFSHLKRMFEEMEKIMDEIENKDAVSYAIFFHDTAYDVQTHEDVEKSCDFFNKFSSDSKSEKVLTLAPVVEQLIMAQKSYNIEDQTCANVDVQYFLDLDISVLGSESSEYKKSIDQIREEYSFLPKQKYIPLRLKVLQQFLQIPRIFATELFHKKYEAQSRCNIQSEIDSLQKELSMENGIDSLQINEV